MRVAYLSAEVAPFAKTGGLGDVAGALPNYLRHEGVDCRIFMPRYGHIDPAREFRHHVPVPMRWGHTESVLVEEGRLPGGAPVYFLEHHGLYGGRAGIYGDRYGEFGDNGYRFAVFCRAALQSFGHLGWWPDVVHCHDWHTGPALAYMVSNFGDGDPRSRMGRVFTIHNQAYQGWQAPAWLDSVGLPRELLRVDAMEHHGAVNLLKTGIQLAHKVTTVSPTYAWEIQTSEGGFGLDATVRWRSRDLVGILNGIDMDEWNPQADPHLGGLGYHSGDLGPKAELKLRLQAEMGLGVDSRPLLLGIVSRMVGQKGLELVLDALPTLMNRPVQLAVLGSGAQYYQDRFRQAVWDYPGRVAVKLGYDNPLAHRIEAGVDAFLMPSLYEPCGLNQMYSLRYGTLPIVRRTGGLADTVDDLDESPFTGVGFVFDEYHHGALAQAVDRALRWYFDDPDGWHWARVRAMLRDNSWGRSARYYKQLYRIVSEG